MAGHFIYKVMVKSMLNRCSESQDLANLAINAEKMRANAAVDLKKGALKAVFSYQSKENKLSFKRRVARQAQSSQTFNGCGLSEISEKKNLFDFPSYYIPYVIDSVRSMANPSPEHLRYLNHFQFVRMCVETIRILPKGEETQETPYSKSARKLLVLDLDETLVHTFLENPPADCEKVTIVYKDVLEKHIYFKVRPFCREFLENMSRHFDLCVFTASSAAYANAVIDYLDPEGQLFKARYFNSSCTKVNQYIIKDLRILKRDLSDVVIVDNTALCFGFQMDNGVPIVCYTGQDNDQELRLISDFLVHISGFHDVREGIRQYFRWDQFERLYKDIQMLRNSYF